MDKQEYRSKTEQMIEYMKKKSYKEALEIAEELDWKKVKNLSVLNAVSEVYEANGEYQKSRDILFLAFDRSPESKKVIYRLGMLALKLGEVKEAMDCYEEFIALAPKDPNGFIFKYKILKEKNAPLEEQIAVLEEFKKVEYIEKWAFELAQLYRDAGMITECLEECDDLIIWFNEGKYIYKAMELKMQYKPLTPLQQEKYTNRSEAQPKEKKEIIEEKAPEGEEILSDDVRKLMEELEAESAEIEAQKTVPESEPEEEKPLLQKVEATPIIEEEEADEDEGIKLGDTQSMALAAKALASAATVEIPQVDVEPEPVEPVAPPTTVSQGSPYDTGFVVQGRYDLEARSEIGLKAGLTEEQKKLFSYFVPVHGMSEQIVKVLQADKECKTRYGTSRIGNVLIVGRKGSGKTVLAVDIVKAIQKSRRMKQGRVAIVKADPLNKKSVAEIAEKLQGGALVIEKASRLKRKTVEELCEVMEGQTGEMLVVLEDERKPLDRMLNEYPNFKKKFTSRIELPVFINDELVTFAQTYAKENGYKIDEMGILALYSEIDILQRDERVVTVTDVKNVIDDAIENANKPSLKKLLKIMTGKNKDEADRVILKEEDFR